MRALLAAAAVSLLSLTAAAPALAAKTGEGLAGETSDKVVTFFSLGVLLFFTLVIVLGSVIQGRLERRKDEHKAARAAQRAGW